MRRPPPGSFDRDAMLVLSFQFVSAVVLFILAACCNRAQVVFCGAMRLLRHAKRESYRFVHRPYSRGVWCCHRVPACLESRFRRSVCKQCPPTHPQYRQCPPCLKSWRSANASSAVIFTGSRSQCTTAGSPAMVNARPCCSAARLLFPGSSNRRLWSSLSRDKCQTDLAMPVKARLPSVISSATVAMLLRRWATIRIAGPYFSASLATGARMPLTSLSRWASVLPPRKEPIGSITTSLQSEIDSSDCLRMSMSAKVNISSSVLPFSVRFVPESRCTRETSVRCASRRGRIVSWGSSSAVINITDPRSQVLPSGQGVAVVIRLAISHVRKLLPAPGIPTRSVMRPAAIRMGQSQSIDRGSMSAMHTSIGFHTGLPVSATVSPVSANFSNLADCGDTGGNLAGSATSYPLGRWGSVVES